MREQKQITKHTNYFNETYLLCMIQLHVQALATALCCVISATIKSLSPQPFHCAHTGMTVCFFGTGSRGALVVSTIVPRSESEEKEEQNVHKVKRAAGSGAFPSRSSAVCIKTL